ncbi:MAG: PHP domain-containing protein, partial [Pseudomonadota bacterium]
MTQPTFIHLRLHTEYSLLEGAVRLKKLPGLIADMDMPAVAVTDTNNMFAALEFAEAAAKAGVQPIMGCQVDIGFDPVRPGERPNPPAPVVLLAQSEQGYEHIMALNSCLYLKEDGQLPQATIDQLLEHTDDVICLTGGPGGPVGQFLQRGRRDLAQDLMGRLHAGFGDRLYVELHRHPGEDGTQPDPERLTEQSFVEMAYAMDLPLVATNDVFFPKSDMYEAHDALICIAEGAYVDQQEPRRRLTQQHYLKTPAEMAVLFADLPEALENTVEIAQRCAFKAYKRDPILPKFADDEIEELRRQSNEGLQKRLAVIPHAVPVEDYQSRLDFELKIIEGMG